MWWKKLFKYTSCVKKNTYQIYNNNGNDNDNNNNNDDNNDNIDNNNNNNNNNNNSKAYNDKINYMNF